MRTEHELADPAVGGLLAAVAADVLGPNREDIDPVVAAQVVGLARAFLRQAIELIDNPGRRGGWDVVDVALLQSIGRLSMGIAGAIDTFEALDPEAADRLRAPGARLDIGAGTDWLAIALARSHPVAQLVGVDIFDAALDLAHANVRAAGLTDRIELRHQDAATMDEPNSYDGTWVPLPFLPRVVVGPVLTAAHRNLRPGGWVLAGAFTGPPDDLGRPLTDLRTVRSGGHPWRPSEIVDLLTAADFTGTREVPRTWPAPVRLFAGQRA